jgi:hypothetical protein
MVIAPVVLGEVVAVGVTMVRTTAALRIKVLEAAKR